MNRNMLLNDEMIKKIIESKEFFYQKLKDYFQSYMRFDISDNELNELLNIVENKRPFSFKELIEQDYKYKDILELIGKMISIFDANGYNKNIWNPYDDKRVIAKANVRQNIWTKNLIVYKLTKDITKLSSDSVKNAILYIQNPKMNLTQLSEEHRRETSKKLLKNEYNPDKYFEDIKNYFKDIFEDIKLNNDDNMGFLLSYIIYSNKFKDIWNEEKKEDFNIDMNKVITMKTKNIMLYGAPGVGKTHNYERLITMIENGESEETIFDTISKNETTNNFDNSIFETIKNEKRIEFVTFHQSYSYEDFIEGFRPLDNGNIKLEDGIFKNIVNDALGKIKINEFFSINREIVSERSSYIVESITNDLINIKKDRDNKIVPIPKNLFIELLDNINKGLISLEDIKNRNLDNLETKFDKYMYGYNSILYTLCKHAIENIEYKEQKNFYIIIDEINRGNISKIFGELITLIEEDKRDAYEVTLPYSKDKFKIPSNLYIIATMNSTDKSIATIDIALRRRFTFLKMKPNSDLVENKEAKDLMKELNKHISNAISEDYALGHSYFMKIENEDDLKFVKEYKIKPLLEEYFYGDEDNYKKALKILGFEDELNRK
ncbi:McrB family protein [Aliarcobacter skirrowii]|uniref:McrB family protein n=1 Tax=Aliarcobacter skirrowii TaxID=28200 RepID=UPI0029BC7FC0|nr:AAA family ATPase [Aliarcobacter skirrowii]MDX4034970.1 AAA family ATPase [Aliarcobacter skirrowii]